VITQFRYITDSSGDVKLGHPVKLSIKKSFSIFKRYFKSKSKNKIAIKIKIYKN